MFRRNGRGRLLLIVFVALSIVVITLDFRAGAGGVFEKAKDVSAAIVAPIQRGFTAVFRPVGNFFSSIAEIGDLRRQNEELERALEEAGKKIDQAEAVLDENQSMRDQLDLQESYITMESVVAEVIARPPSNYKWAVIIDKGRADGIRPDMAVIDPDGLVGKVIGADAHTATILLLIDPKGAAAARVEGRRDTGHVDGNGGSQSLSLELIGPGSEIEEGDTVITAGYDGGTFPPGIPVGVVTAVSQDPRDLERRIDVDPFVDFTSIDFVTVLIDTGSKITLREEQ